MIVLAHYDEHARTRADDIALVVAREPHAGTTSTWSQLRARSLVLADRLAGAGVGAGTRCALVMVDHPDVVPAVLAVWRLGAVLVPVDGQWGDGTLGSVLRLSRSDHLVDVGTGVVDTLTSAPHAVPLPDGTAMISFTSGSTSDPKGVVLSHAQLAHAYETGGRAVTELLGRTPATFGVSMRLSGLGVLGMNYLWPAVLGARVVVLPELTLASAARYWHGVRAHGVDLTYLVPPLVHLLNQAAPAREPDGGELACLSGGAPLSTRTQERFQQRFGVPLLNVYGLTEVSFAAFFGRVGPDGMALPGIGRPATVEARLRDADGRVLEGPGTGQLELLGPACSSGYYDNARATSALIGSDGWFASGDLADRDAAGCYTIVGRSKDVALKGAFTVYLHEVEEAALALDGVAEAAAVCLRHPTGEDIGLLVRMHPTAGHVEPAELRRVLELELGRYRAPRRVVVTEEPLARAAQHKIDRRAAEQRWAQLTGARGTADEAALRHHRRPRGDRPRHLPKENVVQTIDTDLFRREGFLELGHRLDDADRLAVLEHFDALDASGRVSPGYQPQWDGEGDERRLRKLRRLVWNDRDLLGPILGRVGVADVAEQVIGPQAVMIMHAAFLKPARVGGHVAPHQDQALWDQDYRGAFSLWIALTDVSPSNGGLYVYPRSHTDSVLPHTDDPDHPWHATLSHMRAELGEPHQFDLRPGEAAMWDRHLVHASDVNTSDEDRRGMVVVFADGSSESFTARDRLTLDELRAMA